MKPIILLISISLMVGCSKKDTPKDCYCDVIKEIKHDSIIQYNPRTLKYQYVYTAEITIVSQCTFLPKELNYQGEVEPYKEQKVGECWKPLGHPTFKD